LLQHQPGTAGTGLDQIDLVAGIVRPAGVGCVQRRATDRAAIRGMGCSASTGNCCVRLCPGAPWRRPGRPGSPALGETLLPLLGESPLLGSCDGVSPASAVSDDAGVSCSLSSSAADCSQGGLACSGVASCSSGSARAARAPPSNPPAPYPTRPVPARARACQDRARRAL
jgi:hypothetical protein